MFSFFHGYSHWNQQVFQVNSYEDLTFFYFDTDTRVWGQPLNKECVAISDAF